jgi:osmotically-inducible protein OsmY
VSVGLSLEDLNSASDLNASQVAIVSPLILEVERRLRATGHIPLFNLHVVQQGSTVILQGHVPTYYLKQLAQAVAMAIPRVDRVQNELDVIPVRM